MRITVKAKLKPTKEQKRFIDRTTSEYITTVNRLVRQLISTPVKLTSKDVIAELPSALKNQAIQDVKSIVKKYNKEVRKNAKKPIDKQKAIKIPTLKRFVAIWNNQNFALKGNLLSFPVLVGGKSTRLLVRVQLTDYQQDLLQHTHGSLRISSVNGKLIAQIAVDLATNSTNSCGMPLVQTDNSNEMGIDLGIKVPAVSVTSTGKTKFYGNGRQNKYVRRRYKSKRRFLGKLKKLSAIKRIGNKEQRWMKDKNHKVSREIVNHAIEQQVSVIKMEQLEGIRSTTRTSRKNNHSLHTWSFFQLQQFIEYKAQLAGIEVKYVNPAYTSQTCPCCGKRNHTNDRNYQCSCGFHSHRDRVGALNVMKTIAISNKIA